MKETFTTVQMAEMFGVSARTLRWYNELGILQPSTQDSKKRYTEREVENLKTIQALRKAGYKPQSIKDILRATAVLPPRPVNMEEVLRCALDAAKTEEQEIVFGTDERVYNTNYKRLRRIAEDKGLMVHMTRGAGVLRFQAKRKKR